MRLEKAMMGQCRAECRGSRNHELTEGEAREREKAQNNRAERRWEELGSHGGKRREPLLPAPHLPWIPSCVTVMHPASLQVKLGHDHAHRAFAPGDMHKPLFPTTEKVSREESGLGRKEPLFT